MKSSLGGLIKDYRLQKNLSQLDIAFAMGWKEPSQLSRIEQGKVEKPRRQMIDKLTKVMQCSPSEKNTLLLAGCYIPSKEEIDSVKKLTLPTLNNWKYPAYVLDFTWRLIDYNNQSKDIYKFKTSNLQDNTNILNILLNNSQSNNNKKWNNYLVEKLAMFKSDQKYNTKERWYIDSVKKNMSVSDTFRKLWAKADLQNLQAGLNNYEMIEVIHNNNLLKYHIFRNGLTYDPRFDIYLHIPADKKTLSLYN